MPIIGKGQPAQIKKSDILEELALEIAVIAVLYVLLSVSIQRKLGNIKRIKEIKKEMNMHMADLKKAGSAMSKDEFAAKQKRITTLASESMRHQLKPTFIVLPIFFLIFYVVLPYLFPASTTPSISLFGFSLTYAQFFIAIAFTMGILSTIMIGIYDRMSAKKAESTAISQNATAQNSDSQNKTA